MKSLRDRVIGFERVKARDLVPNEANWRSHPKAQSAALKGILAEVGIAGALLVYKRKGEAKYTIIDGHLRANTAKDQEWPVIVLDVNDDEARYLLATHDPLAAMAQANQDRMLELLASVETNSQAVKDMLEALANGETQPLLNPIEDVDPRLDEADALREKWGVERGHIWTLGDHRLMCGDSGDRADVQRLMAGTLASCVFADPPYGVSIGAKNRVLNSFQPAGRNSSNIESDDVGEAELYKTLHNIFGLTREQVMADNCAVFVCAPQGGSLSLMMMMMMRDAGLPVRHVLIWRKNQPTFSLGRLDYEYQHEPILFTWKAYAQTDGRRPVPYFGVGGRQTATQFRTPDDETR